MPDLSIIVVNWNTRDLLVECLDSVLQTVEDVTYEIIIVDNASTDASVNTVRERYPHVRLIINNENVGFARANNQAVDVSAGRYLLLLNSDAKLLPGTLSMLMAVAEDQLRAGVVGAQLLNSDGSFQASYTPFPTLWREFLILSGLGRLLYGYYYPSKGPEEALGPQMVDYVEGACLLIRKEAYQAVGGLDEGYFMYAEEVDLCYAMRKKGWQVWYQPSAKVIHEGGGSSHRRRVQREGDLYRSRVRFFRKYYGDRAARFLKLQLYGFTIVKMAIHRLIRLMSGGRYGRSVIPLRHLTEKLRGV